jgi:hypothetical protein
MSDDLSKEKHHRLTLWPRCSRCTATVAGVICTCLLTQELTHPADMPHVPDEHGPLPVEMTNLVIAPSTGTLSVPLYAEIKYTI